MSNYPDWVEDRFGDDIPDWAEERWGDDDYDDDDYDYDNQEERKNEMDNYEIKESINRISKVLSKDNIVALNSFNGQQYTIYVQKDIQELAKTFGIMIPDKRCSNIVEAVKLVNEYITTIQTDLLNLINKFFKEKESFIKGNIDFIPLYSDTKTLNTMISAINQYYGDNSFTKLKDICREFSINLDLSSMQKKLDKYIEMNNSSYSKEIKTLHTMIMNIKNANCFYRETFAMLYVRLEDYAAKEKAINHFLDLVIHEKLQDCMLNK